MTDLSMVDSGDEELDAIILGPNYYVMVKYASKKASSMCRLVTLLRACLLQL